MPISKLLPEEGAQFERAVREYKDAYASVGHLNKQADYKYVLRHWDEAKGEYLFKMMGEKLIISKHIEYSKAKEDLHSEMNELCNRWEPCQFIEEFVDKVLSDPQVQQGKHPKNGYRLEWFVEYLINSDGLVNNEYKDESFFLTSPKTGKKFEITHGCKIMKMLGKIAKEFDLKGFEEFRIAHSRILNQKKISGNLCISIHPNDFATMSDNSYGWDSCMTWEGNGGYSQGTVEMMNSPMVVVAYVAGDKDVFNLGGSDWNSKKWRELFIVHPDVITEICAYPYANESITTQVLEILRSLVVENLGWEQYRHSEMTQWDSEHVINPYDNQENRLVFYSHAMYNDFRFIHKCFLPHAESKWTSGYGSIGYSGLSECLWCGNSSEHWEDLFDHEGCLIGECCDNSFTCSICGERHNYDPQYLDGDPVCDYCFDNYARECAICGELKHEDSFETIYLGSVKGEWISIEFDPILVCADHLKQALEKYAKEDCQFYYLEQPWNKYTFIDIEDLSDEGQRYFFYDVDESNVEYIPNRHSRWDGTVISN